MEFHNLDLLVSTIRDRGFKSICIQSKDTNQSISVCDHLQELFKSDSTIKFYILADILSGSCCLDVVATKRFQTDCLVYIGDGCYFELDVPIYVFYLYFKLPVQLEPIIAKLDWLCNSLDFDSALCVYSSSFYHILNEVATRFRATNKRFYFTGLNCCQDATDKANPVGDETLMVCNRPVYEHTTDNSINNDSTNNLTFSSNLYGSNCTKLKKLEGNSLLVLYISNSKDDSMTKLLGLSVRYKYIYQIIVESDANQVNTASDGDPMDFNDIKYHLEDRTDLCTNHLIKRYSMVEKAQKASNFGIIVLTKSFKGGTRLRQLLQRLLLLKDKSYGLFSVNHLTEAKLLNFSKVELWVLLSCNFTPLSLPRELEKMLIYPYELLVAMGVLDWGSYVFSYSDLSQVLESHIATLECSDGTKNLAIDSGLVDGNENGEVGPNLQLNRLQNMEIRERFETLYENISCNDDRTFKGLDPEFKGEVKVVKGSKGTASSYEHEGQYL